MTRKQWVDHYAILELYEPVSRSGKGPAATPEEIKKQRNEMIKRFHPDKYRQGTVAWQRANARCQRVNTTYDVLGDPESKRAYDEKWLKRNPWFENPEQEDAPGGEDSIPTLFTRLDWEE